MKRALVPLALLVAAAAHGQSTSNSTGIHVHVGYGFSPDFDSSNGRRNLQGPEIGLALPLGSFAGQTVVLEPSFFGGGRFGHGQDNDSDVYRVTLFLRHQFQRGVTFRAGVGYSSSTQARGGNFDGTSDVIFDFGAEIPISYHRFYSYRPYLDVHGIGSPQAKLSGFFLGVGVKL